MSEGHYPQLWAADLRARDLSGRDFRGADLRLVDFTGANLAQSDFTDANLRGARLVKVDLTGAKLNGADLSRAEVDWDRRGNQWHPTNLTMARLADAQMIRCNLEGAILHETQLIRVDMRHANLNKASVYGISTWDVDLDGAHQRDLQITTTWPFVSIDRLELAQFIYLIINNANLRAVLDTLSAKSVLILGRFTESRLHFLDIVRDQVRRHGLVPIVFDFSAPAGTDLTGTIEVLARLSKFVVADISDPASVPHELATVVPYLRRIPVVPILDTRTVTYSMFNDLRSYPWVLEPSRYDSDETLLDVLPIAFKAAHDSSRVLRDGS